MAAGGEAAVACGRASVSTGRARHRCWTSAAEELQELRCRSSSAGDLAGNKVQLQEELGDLLFVCANLARHAEIDLGAALRGANHKFERRFRSMEAQAEAQGSTLATMDLDAQEGLWQRAKAAEKA